MTLYSEHEILKKAEEGGYGVGAFFPLSADWIKPIFQAAEEEHSPLIITNTPELAYDLGIGLYSSTLMKAAHEASVPVAFHMDHGFTTDEKTLGHIMHFIKNDWNSVMYDASMRSLEDNIRETSRIVEICHAGDVAVLGAVGIVPRDVGEVQGYSVPEELLTKPEAAKKFVRETKVDSLAISIGQYVHPLTLGEPRPVQKTAKLNFELLKRIRESVDVHLVLHGGTHVPDEAICQAIKLGISEIKVAALLAIVWADALREYLNENPDDTMTPNILGPALSAVKNMTVEYMKLFGSSGNAW